MTALVLDASAALKLLRPESGSDDVRRHLAAQAAAGEAILVPALFWLEVINVLAMRYRYPPEAIVEVVYELEQVGVTTAEVGRATALGVLDVVARTGLTAYDAAYVVLADSIGAKLLTADAELAAAFGPDAILVGRAPGVTERRMPYSGEPAWARWKGAGQYVAELRAALR